MKTNKVVKTNTELMAMGVVDCNSYRVFEKFWSHPILNEKKIHTCSDGSEVNLGNLPHNLKRLTKHLPAREQTKILALRSEYTAVLGKQTFWKRKAFGNNNGFQHGTSADGKSAAETYEDYHSKRFNHLEKQAEVLELFGKFYSVEEIHHILKVDYTVQVSREVLYDFRREHLSQIKEKQELHKAGHDDMRLSHKRSRLEELCKMYNLFSRKTWETHGLKEGEMALKILKDIKAEVEGDIVLNGSVDINIEATVNTHMQKEALKHITIRQIIIGRVAARVGASPEKLISQLSQSYYTRFAGVVGVEDEEVNYEEIEYPSGSEYDFQQIERNLPKSKEKTQLGNLSSSTVESSSAPKSEQLKANSKPEGTEEKNKLIKLMQERGLNITDKQQDYPAKINKK